MGRFGKLRHWQAKRRVDKFCENLGRYRQSQPLLRLVGKSVGY